MKAIMHIGMKFVEIYAKTKNKLETENPMASVQNRAEGLNLSTPKSIIQIRAATAQTANKMPYFSTENPFSKTKGNIKVNGPEARKLMIIKQGMKSFKCTSEKIDFIADFESFKMLFTVTDSPCCELLGTDINNSEIAA
jgi:hypothetical protein